MSSLESINKVLKENKERLFRAYPIKSLAIFGSYSRSENGEGSDLDILIEFNDRIGARFIDLAHELEDLTGANVDLVSKNGLKSKYFKSIQEDLRYV